MPAPDPGATPASETGPIEFPPVHEAMLDDEGLRQLLDDIQQHAVQVEIIVKGHARGRASDQAVTLDEARSILAGREARGVQLRYRYQHAQWWDTLVIRPDGVRLVRIRHEFTD